MFKISLTAGSIPIIIGALIMGLTDLIICPWFFFVLGGSLFPLCNKIFKFGFIGLGISLVLFSIAHFAEPEWLEVFLEVL